MDDEERTGPGRKNKRRSLLPDRENHGEREDHASGSSPENRSPTLQHQQSDAAERGCEYRVLAEDSGEFGTRFGTTDAAEDIGEAA